MGWNNLSICKLQRLHCWSLGMDKYFHPTLYWACDCLSMPELKLNHVSKRGHWAFCTKVADEIVQLYMRNFREKISTRQVLKLRKSRVGIRKYYLISWRDNKTPRWDSRDLISRRGDLLCRRGNLLSRRDEIVISPRWLIISPRRLIIPFASTKLKGVYTDFTLSVCPSVDRIGSALYLQQYSSDPLHICISYQATSECVSHVKLVSKFKNLQFWQIPEMCNFDFVLFWLGIQYD